MKKYLSIILAMIMVLGLAACGSDGNNQGASSSIESAKACLEAIWEKYAEADKFPAMGGDFSEENLTDGAPGAFSLEDAEAVDSVLGVPQDLLSEIDDAASLMHMMNANTFTCGAFHVSGDSAKFTDGLKDAIMNRQWMCGFPDTLIIAKVDDYVISAFGADDLIQTLKAKISEAYGGAEIICEESLAF